MERNLLTISRPNDHDRIRMPAIKSASLFEFWCIWLALAFVFLTIHSVDAKLADKSRGMANAFDIFGDTRTQEIEKKIEFLQSEYPRKQSNLSSKQADEAYRKLDVLVSQIPDVEQLIRLGYWAKTAHPCPYDSPVNLVDGTCGCALQRIKILFPAQSQDAIYEMAMLIRADGGSAEMIDAMISDSEKPPERRLPGVYVHVGRAKDASTPALLALHFNLTRVLWSQWKANWSGKFLFDITAIFELDGRGNPKNIRLSSRKNSNSVSSTALESAMPKVRQIILDGAPYYPREAGKSKIKVAADFYG